jgi:hypothetical protein
MPQKLFRTLYKKLGCQMDRFQYNWVKTRVLPELPGVREKDELSLVVLGDLDHFRGSILGKIATKHCCIHHVGQSDLPDRLAGRSAWIKWSPWSKYKIPNSIAARIPKNVHIINNTHFNCSKHVVEEHFEDVFGYALRVDLTNFCGKAVKKNALHDGKVVSLPEELTLNTNGDFVYEHVINNTFRNFVCDIRVPVILGEVPFAYLKIRPLENRFLE